MRATGVSLVALFAILTPDLGESLHSRALSPQAADVLQQLILEPLPSGSETPASDTLEVRIDRISGPLLPVTVVGELESPNQVVLLSERRFEGVLAEPQLQRMNDSGQVNQLLAQAKQALKIDRLMTPPNDNAYDRFRQVLVLDGSNAQALAGMETLRTRYLALLDRAVERQRFRQVPDLLASARKLGVEQQQLTVYQQRLPSKYQQSVAIAMAVESDLPKENTPPTEDVQQQGFPWQEHAILEHEVPSQEMAPPPEVVESPRVKYDKAIALTARKLLQAGREPEAEKKLQTHLRDHPDSVFAWKVLFDHYLMQRNWSGATALLSQADHFPQFQLVENTALLLSLRGDLEGAISLLNTEQPSLSQAATYYRLKASVLMRQGQLDAATDLFTQLLTVDGGDMTSWLGLARALDLAGNTKARQLYEKLAESAVGTEPYLPLVERRLAAASLH